MKDIRNDTPKKMLNDVQNLLSTNSDINAANSEGTTLVLYSRFSRFLTTSRIVPLYIANTTYRLFCCGKHISFITTIKK